MAKQSTKKKTTLKKPVSKKKPAPSKPIRKPAVKKKAVVVKAKAKPIAPARKIDVVKAKKLTPLAKKTVREEKAEKIIIQLPACYPEPIRKKITLIPGKILTANGWIKLSQED
jgi:hypothetical protein